MGRRFRLLTSPQRRACASPGRAAGKASGAGQEAEVGARGKAGPGWGGGFGWLVWMILWALGHRAVLSHLLPGPGSVMGRGNTGFVSDEEVAGPQHGVQQPAVKGMLQASCAPAPGVVARGGRVSPQASQASRDVGIQDIENKRRD